MINVKSKNLKQLPLISHVFHYFFGNNFSMLTFIYLGATSYVSITLVSLLITISLQKYQEKNFLKKKIRLSTILKYYLILWYIVFKTFLCVWIHTWLTGKFFLFLCQPAFFT